MCEMSMLSSRYASLLELPFFEPRHRQLVERVAAWAAAFPELPEPDNQQAVFDHCRGLLASLGAAGLIRHAIWSSETAMIDVRSICLTRQILAAHSGLADFVFALQGLGSGAISLFGTVEQRSKYLGPVGEGRLIPAFALSESESGSDVASISTRAHADGNGYVLNGEKAWISNAGIADFYVVFARTASGVDQGSRGLSAFVVEADQPGIRIVAQVETTSPHPFGIVEFDRCRLSSDALVGNLGEGMKIALSTLDVFRPSVAAAAVGFAQRAIAEALRYVTKRKVFGGKLSDLQATRTRLAEMSTQTMASELLVYKAAWVKDNGKTKITEESAMAKFFATESAQITIDSCVQLLGARGVVRGSIAERLLREIRPLRIYEGATEIQKNIIGDGLVKAWEQAAE